MSKNHETRFLLAAQESIVDHTVNSLESLWRSRVFENKTNRHKSTLTKRIIPIANLKSYRKLENQSKYICKENCHFKF